MSIRFLTQGRPGKNPSNQVDDAVNSCANEALFNHCFDEQLKRVLK